MEAPGTATRRLTAGAKAGSSPSGQGTRSAPLPVKRELQELLAVLRGGSGLSVGLVPWQTAHRPIR